MAVRDFKDCFLYSMSDKPFIKINGLFSKNKLFPCPLHNWLRNQISEIQQDLRKPNQLTLREEKNCIFK